MPNTQPPLIDDASLTTAEQAAKKKAVCDYGIHLGASTENLPYAHTLADRVCGLKMYLDATYGTLKLDDIGIIREFFARWTHNHPILCHAEDRALAAILWCAFAENRSVHICHVSRRSEIQLIREAKERGINVTCEVTPHHLFLSTADIASIGTGRAEVRPCLAAPDDVAALWDNMAYIDCIATDHAPHLLSEKDSAQPPPGFAGLETALPLMLTAVHHDRITIEAVIERMAHAPRRIFSLPDQENTWIEVDPDIQYMIRGAAMQTRCKWTPFEGMNVRGRITRVVIRSEVAFENDQILAKPGSGRNLAPVYQKDQL